MSSCTGGNKAYVCPQTAPSLYKRLMSQTFITQCDIYMNYNGGGGEDTGGIPLPRVLGRLQGEAQVLNFEEAEAVRE